MADIPVLIAPYGMSNGAKQAHHGFIAWVPAGRGALSPSTHFIYYSKDKVLADKTKIDPKCFAPLVTDLDFSVRQPTYPKFVTQSMVDAAMLAFDPTLGPLDATFQPWSY